MINHGKKILDLARQEFVYGGHVLSLGAVSIVVTAARILILPIEWKFLVMAYLLVYMVYLYDRYIEIKKDLSIKTEWAIHFRRYYAKLTPMIICAGTLIIVLICLIEEIKIIVAILGFFMFISGLFYGSYLKKITKKIPGFKNLFVPLIWALLVILMSLFYSSPLSLGIWLFSLFVYLRIFIGVSFSDIKDIDSDKAGGIKTLVVIFGQKKFLRILAIVNILPVIILVSGVLKGILPFFSLVLIAMSLYSYFYLWIINRRSTNVISLTGNLVYAENVWWAPLILLAQGIL